MSRVNIHQAWERGVALPGGSRHKPKTKRTEKGPTSDKGSKPDSPKVRLLPPAPKQNPWGAKQSVAAASLRDTIAVDTPPKIVGSKANGTSIHATPWKSPSQSQLPSKPDVVPKESIVKKITSPWKQLDTTNLVRQTHDLKREQRDNQDSAGKQVHQVVTSQTKTASQHQQQQQSVPTILLRKKNAPWGTATASSDVKQHEIRANTKEIATPQVKKRKPKLGSMSLGDLIPKNHAIQKVKAATGGQPHNTQGAVSIQSESSGFPAPESSSNAKTSSSTQKTATKNTKKARVIKDGNSTISNAKPKKKKQQQLQKSPIPGMPVPVKEDDKPVQMDAHHAAAALGGFFSTSETGGGVGDLARLYSEGKVQKGRQRVKPRKKKFSSLKKKVLEERLRKWKELHPDLEESSSTTALTKATFTTTCIYGYYEFEELEDEDEYNEIVSNLHEMAIKIGAVKRVFIPNDQSSTASCPAFVEFSIESSAAAAVECWNDFVIGGQKLKCTGLQNRIDSTTTSSQDETSAWQASCIAAEQIEGADGDAPSDDCDPTTDVVLLNAMNSDDLEDEECMEESLQDIQNIVSKYGPIESAKVVDRETAPVVVIKYRLAESDARAAVSQLCNLVIGGQHLVAQMASESDRMESCVVYLRNVLSDDDLEDEDCLEESLNDVRELAQQFGEVENVTVNKEDNAKAANAADHTVRIYYSSGAEAQVGADKFHGMVIGGLTVSASCKLESEQGTDNYQSDSMHIEEKKEPERVMMSGDKVIPERFAACKRVPKIPNTENCGYATLSTDDSVKPLLKEMLSELIRLQVRAVEENNAKAKKRVCMGLREVARGIRSNKVKMVIMANNLDNQYGVIDEKLREIINLANEAGIAVFYEFSKRTLGKAVGKAIKVAVAGILNAEGAHQPFKKLNQIASKR